MKVSVLKSDKRVETNNDNRFGIIQYGLMNDYPQKVKEITDVSGTASLCIRTYIKFVTGLGFINGEYKHLQREISEDVCRYSGFAILINRNALLEAIDPQPVPFETCRLSDDCMTIKTHPDWARRGAKPFDESKLKTYYRFSTDKNIILSQIQKDGGLEKYRGEILWISSLGKNTYPTPVYDCVITDISSEDGIATVRNRNVKNNFLPAGMIIEKGGQMYQQYLELAAKPYEELTQNERDLRTIIENVQSSNDRDWKQFQGDERAFKLIRFMVGSDEEKPEFVEFPSRDGDKLHEYSESACQRNIGNAFNQPPVLRGQLIAGKLGTSSEIIDAYNYYNSITIYERNIIKDAMTLIEPSKDWTVEPLKYMA